MRLSWRKSSIYLLSTLLGVLLFLWATDAFAQGITPDGGGSHTEPERPGTFDEIAAFLYALVVAVFGWLVYAGGWILNLSLTEYVFKFGENYIAFFGYAIDYLWSVMRDLFNLTFIFGLIYIGFRLIFDSEDSRARRALVLLIGAALLVNFSLFISKTIVDFTNLAAFELANGIAAIAVNDPTNTDLDIAQNFMDVLGIGSIFNFGEIQGSTAEAFKNFSTGGVFAYIFGIMIIFFIAAFCFAAGGLLMITRFIALCLFLIFSPIMFLGWVFPAFSSFSTRWWRSFLGYAFMAPAYVFMLAISLRVLSAFQGQFGIANGGLAAAFTNNAGAEIPAMGIVTFFLVAAGFLIASLVVARYIGGAGAAATINFAHAARRRTQGEIAKRTVAPLARRSQERFRRWEAREEGEQSRAGRAARSTMRALNLDRTIHGGLESAQKSRFGTATSYQEDRDYQDERRRRINQYQGGDERRRAREEAMETMESTTATADELNQAFERLGEAVRNMTIDEKQRLKVDQLTDERIAAHLTDKEIDQLQSSGKFSNNEIQSIRDARDNAFTHIAQNGVVTYDNAPNAANDPEVARAQRQFFATRSVNEIGNMPVEVFTQNGIAPYITPQMIEQRMRNGQVNDQDLQNMRNNIQDHINSLPAGPDRQRIVNMWQNWQNRSVYGAQFGLNLGGGNQGGAAGGANPNPNPGGGGNQGGQAANPHNRWANPGAANRYYNQQGNNQNNP